jgi:hypothetical protein
LTRTAMGRTVLSMTWLLLAFAAGCSACEPVQPLSVGEQCSLNSECDAPLVCRIGACRIECSTSRDCAAGLDCLLDNDDLGACQLPDETRCALASDCPSPLVCNMSRCTNVCAEDRDCPPGATCMPADMGGTACVDPDRTACLYNTDCEDDRVCAPDQRCRVECLVDTDCRYRTVCTPRVTDAGISNFCEPPRPDAGP